MFIKLSNFYLVATVSAKDITVNPNDKHNNNFSVIKKSPSSLMTL